MANNKPTDPAVSINVSPADAPSGASWKFCAICGKKIFPSQRSYHAKEAGEAYHHTCLEDGAPHHEPDQEPIDETFNEPLPKCLISRLWITLPGRNA